MITRNYCFFHLWTWLEIARNPAKTDLGRKLVILQWLFMPVFSKCTTGGKKGENSAFYWLLFVTFMQSFSPHLVNFNSKIEKWKSDFRGWHVEFTQIVFRESLEIYDRFWKGKLSPSLYWQISHLLQNFSVLFVKFGTTFPGSPLVQLLFVGWKSKHLEKDGF